MAYFPIVCQRCGTLAVTDRLIGGEGAAQIRVENVTLGNACPKCGGDMNVIDGAYEMMDNAATMLHSSEADVGEVNDLLNILRQAREENWSASELRTAIEASAPTFSGVTDWIPDGVEERGTILLVLLTLFQFACQWYYEKDSLEQDRRQHQERMEEQREYHEKMIEEAAKDSSGLTRQQARKMVKRIIEKQTSK